MLSKWCLAVLIVAVLVVFGQRLFYRFIRFILRMTQSAQTRGFLSLVLLLAPQSRQNVTVREIPLAFARRFDEDAGFDLLHCR